MNTNTFALAFEDFNKVYRQVEELLTKIFYQILQTNPKEKSVVILESFFTPRCLTEALGHCCFKSFGIKYVYFLLSNATPLYATGMETGLIIDVGYQQAQILPICFSIV